MISELVINAIVAIQVLVISGSFGFRDYCFAAAFGVRVFASRSFVNVDVRKYMLLNRQYPTHDNLGMQ